MIFLCLVVSINSLILRAAATLLVMRALCIARIPEHFIFMEMQSFVNFGESSVSFQSLIPNEHSLFSVIHLSAYLCGLTVLDSYLLT